MRAVLRLMERYEVDRAHAEQVKELALSLFDGLQDLHGLPSDARRLLEFGALLHDVGHHIAGEDHNKHGQYLIQHSRLQGFTAPDVAILGNVVRYHRGGRPKKTHPSFAALARADQRMVLWLASLLRVADGLDRSHEQPIESVRAAVVDGTIEVHAEATAPAHLEHWAVERRKVLLERTSQKPVEVHISGFPEAVDVDSAPPSPGEPADS
jgi:exopolyphosphatase/guanosine-5'-triphosphate,3'-diphosphate pyrophosphatase